MRATLTDALANGPELVLQAAIGKRGCVSAPRLALVPAASPCPQVKECSQVVAATDRLDRAGGPEAGLALEELILLLVEADHRGIEDDVGVQDLAGQRVDPRRPHGKAAIGSDPAERVVVDVLGVEVLVLLLPHL